MSEFAYDTPSTVPASTAPLGHCFAAFRPQVTWDGSSYGFDWMRVCDSGLPGDILYAENMGEYLKSDGERINMIPSFQVAHINDFVKNPIQYSKLVTEYFVDNHHVLWNKPATPFACTDAPSALQDSRNCRKNKRTLNSERRDHLKRIKEEAGYTCFTPIMTLMKDNEAALQLVIEFMPSNPKPKGIEIVADVPENFRITANIDPNNAGTFKCTIRALRTFDDDQWIRVKATYVGADGNDTTPEECGKLKVLKNKLRGTINVNCFVVRLQNAGVFLNHNFSNTQSATMQLTAKFLNQAMLGLNLRYNTISELRIDINRMIKHPEIWSDMYSFSSFLSPDNTSYKSYPFDPCLRGIQNQIIEPFFQITNNFATTTFSSITARLTPTVPPPAVTVAVKVRYNKFIRNISIWDARKIEAVKEMLDRLDNEICVFFLDLPYSGSTLGVSSKKLNIIFYNTTSSSTTAHEICHSLDLAHSFACEVVGVEKSDKAKFSYKALITDNLMDYSNSSSPVAKISTWHWQWKIMWNKIREINNSTPATTTTPRQTIKPERSTFLQDKATEMDDELRLLLEKHAQDVANCNNRQTQEMTNLNSQAKVKNKDRRNMERKHAKETDDLTKQQEKEITDLIDNYERLIRT